MKRKIIIYISILVIAMFVSTTISFCTDGETGGFGLDISVDDVAVGGKDARDSVLVGYNVKLFTDDAEERYSEVKAERQAREKEQFAEIFNTDFSFEKNLDLEKKQMIDDAHLFSGGTMHYGQNMDPSENKDQTLDHTMALLGNALKWIAVGVITAVVTVVIIRRKRNRNGYYNNYQRS